MIVDRSDWVATLPNLEALFQESFGRPVRPSYLDWRYYANGQEKLLFAVERRNATPIASYSACPVELICNGRACATAISMTTMTHPDWRGQGLFQKLATELYTHAEAAQISAVWGFPNANSHPTFVGKLGWVDIYEIPTMVLELNKNPMHDSVAVREDSAFDMAYPESPKDGFIRVHRTRDYLRWRYARSPINKYRNFVISSENRVSSYIVTKKFGDGVDLVDIQVASAVEARAILAKIVNESVEEGSRTLQCWVSVYHGVHAVLERFGFVNAGPITYFGGRELVPGILPADWQDFRRWYLQMGDSDVF